MDQRMNTDFYKKMPSFKWIQDPENPQSHLYRHDLKIYYASDIPDEWLKKVPEIIEYHEGDSSSNPSNQIVAYLGRPDSERTRDKWIITVIRGHYRDCNDEPIYTLGLIHGVLISGLCKQ